MISEYIKLLESFKQHQISKLIEKINARVLETLESPHFNSRIGPYFATRNKTGVPFTNFELDPDNIAQIKKLINALYHARLAFIDLENANVKNWDRKSLASLAVLYNHTIHEAYQASYLATHLEVDFNEMFRDEIELLLPVVDQLNVFIQAHSQETLDLADTLKDFPIGYKVGEITGIAIDQMEPRGGDWDYKFLTEFSAELPGYIEKLTQYIQQYSDQLIENEPTLNNAKLEELEDAAFKLLNDLENLKGNSLFLSLKFLNYIHIIRNIITLSMSSLEQMGNLSDSSQDVIRDKLAQLKYEVLPTLFGLVDKIEDNAMLKPGTLSNPLMEKVKPLYALLIHYASKPVNFEAKGKELLSIEDSRFLALRLERSYKRIDTANKGLFKVQKAQEALDRFYEILDNPQCANRAIHELPGEIKEELIRHYKIIKPYMQKADFDLNDLLINSLHGGESWSSYLSKPWRWVRGTRPSDHVEIVLEKRVTLQNLITKQKATHQFHIDLNTDLIHSVQQQTNLVLFPYSEKTNVFTIDESTALNPANKATENLVFKKQNEHNVLTNPEHLTADQALDLYQWYRNKREKFEVAREAYNKFITIIRKELEPGPQNKGKVLYLNKMDKKVKDQCRNLYNLFQPYFINGIPAEFKTSVIDFDRALVQSFSDENTSSNIAVDLFERLDEHFQIYFTEVDLNWGKKSRLYLKYAHEKFTAENEAAPLEKDPSIGDRGHHLLQHTNYSKYINQFRTELSKVISVLNASMQAELQPASTGLPFPEMQDKHLALAQSKQVVAIKRIFNALYHIEGIVLELEKLDNRSTESRYVYHLLQAYGHINDIMKLTKDLAADPHFKIIAGELLEKAQTLVSTVQEHSDAYQVAPESVPYKASLKYNALWYVLNAFYISPKHIRSLRNNNYLTTEELNELHVKAKKASANIEAIIDSSSSYFRLFLQAPAMYSLYRELTTKLNEFIGTAHDTAMNNLDQFQSKIFTPMLLEADLWEDKLGLIPGSISGPLKNMIDEYYKGLLHPLALPSKVHIDLVCDMSPTEKRLKTTRKQIESATKHIDKLDLNYQHVIKLYETLKSYENLSGGFIPAPHMVLEMSKRSLIEDYKNALPKLVSIQSKLEIDPDGDESELKLDSLLNAELKEYQPKLTQIKALIHASYSYYQGLKASYQMQSNTAQEKLTYLSELKQKQQEANLLFVKEYTTESFDKQLETLCNRYIGLQYTDDEYTKRLKTYLLTFKIDIINKAKTSDDINLAVKNLLKNKIKIFEQQYFAEYYHLDTVRAALAEFKNYFRLSTDAIQKNRSFFENEDTLAKKTALINNLIAISKNETLTVEQRFASITREVKNPNFKRIMTAHHKEDHFSFTYIIQCIANLLEALHLYTPARKKHYNDLTTAVNTKPQIHELTKRFGLFAEPTAPAPVALEPENEPTVIEPSPHLRGG